MSEPFLGEILIAGFNFAPRGYAFCGGQLVSIAQNTALFALLGTTYGGNGQTTFALPDLRGRVATSQGQGPGLANQVIGEQGGDESVILLPNQMPAHTHAAVPASDTTELTPSGKHWAPDTAGNFTYSNVANVALNSGAIGSVGGGTPHDNMAPYLGLNYCIALEGIFPSRN